MSVPISLTVNYIDDAAIYSSKVRIDCSRSLQEILNRDITGLVPQLLEIQKHRIQSEKLLKLTDLGRPFPMIKRRSGANCIIRPRVLRQIQGPSLQKNYIAVSYPWGSSSEDPVGEYEIELKRINRRILNTVRDAVLNGVIKYAVCHGIHLIWIDQECINQDDFREKETALLSMDIV